MDTSKQGPQIVFMPSQVFTFNGWHWDIDATHRIVDALIAARVEPGIVINPMEWVAGIKHDPLFGKDRWPHFVPRPAWMDPQFSIEIDKRAALELSPLACARPGIAVPTPDGPDEDDPECRYWIIDGWKRIFRAYTLGLTEFRVYPLNRETEVALRVDQSWMTL